MSQAVYYAANVKAAAAGANVVTVSFSSPAAFPDVRAMAYRGLSTNPFDGGASASGNSSMAKTGVVNTTVKTDVLVGAGTTDWTYNGAGNGFTTRVITSPDADIAEDSLTNGAAGYAATAPVTGNWVMQVIALKAASQQ